MRTKPNANEPSVTPKTPWKVTHAFMECPTARTAVEAILKRWEYTTGEQLDPTNEATILFGDREANLKLPSQALDEPFRVMHAALMHSLWDARNATVHEKDKTPGGRRISQLDD